MQLVDIVTTHASLTVSLSFWSRDDDPCEDGGALSFGQFAPPETPEIVLHGSDTLHGDWTGLDELDLTVREGPSAHPGCINTIVARAPLEWTVPSLRPWLAELTDGGPRDGAQGRAETAEGAHTGYVVAVNDTEDAIAARFGISADDLDYLNDTNVGYRLGGELRVGERLNLSLSER